MKKIVFIIWLMAVCYFGFSEIVQIPATKIFIDLPVDYFLIPNSNMLMTKSGNIISSMDMQASFDDFAKQMVPNEVSIDGMKITSSSVIDKNKLLLNISGFKRNEELIGYCIVFGTEEECALVFGLVRKINEQDLSSLYDTLINAKYDSKAEKDYSRIKYFDVQTKVFVIEKFFGDRFYYSYIGKTNNIEDSIEFEIGSIFHNYNLTVDMYPSAAKTFSFRPPFSDLYNLGELEMQPIEINTLKGMYLQYNLTKKNEAKKGSAYEYILFSANRIYFLRAKVYAQNPEDYSRQIIEAFNTFKLSI